jgi:cytochrome c-type biogenesis protein CcmH/NrfG
VNARGLPPRIYLPFVLVFAVLFLGTMAYLVNIGLGVRGAVFGASGQPAQAQSAQQRVEGGPPPAIALEWQTLQRRVARHPRDDVALTQLGDLELTADRYSDAVTYYRRALAVNPHNAAAVEGLNEAENALRSSQ